MPSQTVDDFDYELPPELIAQYPSDRRSGSRLLRVDGSGALHDERFVDLPAALSAGDVLVLNDTRVMKARMHAQRPTGGRVEVLIERLLSPAQALAQLRFSHAPKAGERLDLGSGLEAEVLGRREEFFLLRLCGDGSSWSEVMERHGEMPLPPYIDRAPQARDEARYQTVYARVEGAVAAPTAGLHFDRDMLAAVEARGVTLAWLTLHVGAGTFQPIRAPALHEHRMHTERFSIPRATVDAIERAQAAGGHVVAVGTKVVRALESAASSGRVEAATGDTSLFITPGYGFRVVDRLLTNFHLPRSTLLMLVSAFAGSDRIRRAYSHAVEQRYRFFSYGDAMLLDRAGANTAT